MPTTLTDIARETGLATSSVADVLRGRPGYAEKTRQRVLETAQRLDFVPNHFARSLLMQRSHTIGVGMRMDNSPVTGPTLHALAKCLTDHGYMPLFADTSAADGDQNAVRELRARSVDGLIIATGDEAPLRRLVPRKLPLVQLRNCPGSGRIPAVIGAYTQAMGSGVRWLAERGHRRIAFMGVDNVPAMRGRYNTHRLKIEGYRQGMAALGLDDPALLLDAASVPGEARRFVRANAALFADVTAVVACSDRVAVEVISGLHDLGLQVPGDCSVIGFDDTEFAAAMRPTLTTFQPRRAEIGVLAARMMLDLIAGRKVEPVTVTPQLIERESAGPAPRR